MFTIPEKINKQFNKEVQMTKKNGVNHSLQLSVVSRRKSVITRLENQLKIGIKTTKEGNRILSDHDIKRINQELVTLKSRV